MFLRKILIRIIKEERNENKQFMVAENLFCRDVWMRDGGLSEAWKKSCPGGMSPGFLYVTAGG